MCLHSFGVYSSFPEFVYREVYTVGMLFSVELDVMGSSYVEVTCRGFDEFVQGWGYVFGDEVHRDCFSFLCGVCS